MLSIETADVDNHGKLDKIQGSDTQNWDKCEPIENETTIIRLDKGCKNHLICYPSKLAKNFGNWKANGRMRVAKVDLQELSKKCAENDGPNQSNGGWHGLMIAKQNDGQLEFQSSLSANLSGKLGTEFFSDADFLELNFTKALMQQNGPLSAAKFDEALPLGAFIKDFEGMALRIVALELTKGIGQMHGTKMCKTMCDDDTTIAPSTTRMPPPMPAPKASNIDHLGLNCTQIEFVGSMPKIWLNMSVFPYAIACEQYEAPFNRETMYNKSPTGDDSFDACQKVPTSSNCDKRNELIVCYKRKSQTAVVNNEIGKICQKHLKIGQQKAHGFRIRLCTHREAEKQRIIVESVLDFSFTDEIHKSNRGFSYKVKAMLETLERTELFFIQFGNNDKQQSVALSDGKEISPQLSKTIGTILPSIASEPSSSPNKDGRGQHRTKQLHFVPPAEELRIFFQTPWPMFSQRITRKTNLLPFESNPNKTAPNICDLLADDCEATREILLQIREVLQCCSPFNPWNRCRCNVPNITVDKSEFAAPPGEKMSAPDTTPSSSSSSNRWGEKGDPLYWDDIFYTREMAQKRYDDYMEDCSKCVRSTPAEKSTKKRRKRQTAEHLNKWTKFPIAIHMNRERIPADVFDARKEAIKHGMELIMKDTCITLMLYTNKTAEEGIEVIVDGRNSWSEIGKTLAKWQELSLDWNSNGTAAHELLHALAIYHEHQRDDAFYFIKVNPICRMDGNYQPFNKTDNFGFPYDFDSVMQYPAHIDKQGYYYLITMGRFYQRTIGQDKRLSFKDSAIINHMYCKDYCNGTKNECQNGGYPSPKQCNECLCPEGYAGAHCDQLAQNQNCVDLSGTPNHLEADWQIRDLKPKLKCTGAEICPRICGTNHVEIIYRKDKRARGALLCCANDILQQNISRNWIGAEEADVDIIISAR
ncbi:hypothetical protein niasHT_002202 [Heterodera trifolii]|uniref:Metalloendopeptidase n=1 Tax=Heterodera trifolii TaxID=157864 RepID=A0ABD2LXP8_9BILA